MSDRELLELAAKAAGLTVNRFNPEQNHIYTNTLGKWWSPLLVDGDTFRLAIQLNISIQFDDHEQCTIAEYGDGDKCTQYWDGLVSGKPEATRRAVVRAAAEIGRTMP